MIIKSRCLLIMLLCFPIVITAETTKVSSSLYPKEVIVAVQENAANDPWAASVRDKVVNHAQPWMEMSDDALWDLVFGATLPRSWMVWSNGYSPATGDPVPMYNWEIDVLAHPWKVKCPHSGELFPKNDFKAYYDSGLDAQGIFDASLADRSLLFNAEHPDPDDPLHHYGVDDGHGYINEKEERWLFIATYLIYGQWKEFIVGGIRNCSAAYVVTGDPVYARKAGILLDRVADVYPTFSFGKQGILYEGPGSTGYVSTWHDACEETREMVMCYDMIFDALKEDTELVAFLSEKAKVHNLENSKATFAQIQENIEIRILRDALANPKKIHSNYPRAEILKALIVKVLQAPEDEFWALADPMFTKATAVDGVTGEKGLAGYSSYTIAAMAMFLAELSKADDAFLPDLLERYPKLRETYRFHIDTHCLGTYYPQSGDCGWFAGPFEQYVGMNFLSPGVDGRGTGGWTVLSPSTHRLLWDFYHVTQDPAYVQVSYRQNNRSLDGLPYDLFSADPGAFRDQVQQVIEEHGEEIALDSVNKEAWHLGIMRSGEGADRRAVWLDYDAGGGHGHLDGMNLGLFAHGLDLMTEFGYPPVQFGGWGAPRATWYKMTAAHNTVVVDGKNQPGGHGTTTLWASGRRVQVMRAEAPALNNGNRYERTIVLVEVSDEQFYVVDVFRVAGGSQHTKFVHSAFGDMTTEGLTLEAVEEFGHDTQMRNMQRDATPEPGWQATWHIDDHYDVREDDNPVGLRYMDFTTGASAARAEAWVVAGSYNSMDEAWINRLLIQREKTGDAPLESTFVSVYAPFEGDAPGITAKRIPVFSTGGIQQGDTHVALRIDIAEGGHDILLVQDPDQALYCKLEPDEFSVLETDARLAFAHSDAAGEVTYSAMAKGTELRYNDYRSFMKGSQPFFELGN